MSTDLLIRTIATWLLFLPVPIINGFLRENWYAGILGTTAAHQLGAFILSGFFLLYAYVSLRHVAYSLHTSTLWRIGFMWFLLTLIFEFGIGIMGGHTWSEMLVDYKIWEGRIWPLVLVTIVCSPFVVRHITKAGS